MHNSPICNLLITNCNATIIKYKIRITFTLFILHFSLLYKFDLHLHRQIATIFDRNLISDNYFLSSLFHKIKKKYNTSNSHHNYWFILSSLFLHHYQHLDNLCTRKWINIEVKTRNIVVIYSDWLRKSWQSHRNQHWLLYMYMMTYTYKIFMYYVYGEVYADE